MTCRISTARAWSLSLSLAMAVALAACGSGSDGSKGSDLPEADADLEGTITLGAVLPLTGTNATLGKDTQRGVELAVAKVNAEGGVLGKELVVNIEDSRGEAEATIQAAKKLVSVDDVPVVIGEYSSGNTIPMQQYLQSQGIVGINPVSSSAELRGAGSLQFSTIGLDDIAGGFAARALNEKGYESIAILAPNNSYGTGIIDSVSEAFEELGGTVTATSFYAEGQSDYRQELRRLQQSEPDAYVVTTYGKDGTVINNEMYELSMIDKPVFDIYMSQDVPDANPTAVEGRIGMDVAALTNKEYADYYQDTYGEKFISSWNGYTYDAVMMLAAAINAAESVEPEAIAAALNEVSKSYDGVTGPIAIDTDGQRGNQPYILATVRDGEIVPD